MIRLGVQKISRFITTKVYEITVISPSYCTVEMLIRSDTIANYTRWGQPGALILDSKGHCWQCCNFVREQVILAIRLYLTCIMVKYIILSTCLSTNIIGSTIWNTNQQVLLLLIKVFIVVFFLVFEKYRRLANTGNWSSVAGFLFLATRRLSVHLLATVARDLT